MGRQLGWRDRRRPKCSKTWLGLDIALSVATGTACLGKYAVPQPGPVLVYLAEDALPVCASGSREWHDIAASISLGVEIHVDHCACSAARSRSGPNAAPGDERGGSGLGCCSWIRS